MRSLLLVSLCCVATAEAQDMKRGEILPHAEMKAKYQLTCENRPTIRLEEKRVPPDLRDLIPFAEKWGIGDDIIRYECQSQATAAEKAALVKALKGRNKRIRLWLDSISDKAAMSDEAAAFMYMQEGLDEMGLWVD